MPVPIDNGDANWDDHLGDFPRSFPVNDHQKSRPTPWNLESVEALPAKTRDDYL